MALQINNHHLTSQTPKTLAQIQPNKLSQNQKAGKQGETSTFEICSVQGMFKLLRILCQHLKNQEMIAHTGAMIARRKLSVSNNKMEK